MIGFFLKPRLLVAALLGTVLLLGGLSGCKNGPFQTTELELPTVELLPNDTFFAEYQWNLPLINAPRAWALADLLQAGGDASHAVVAVIDQAVQAGHPDLAGVLTNDGYDFVRNTTIPGGSTTTTAWHGTHVAGIIGALTNNEMGVAGVAGNRAEAPRVKIMPLAVLGDDGSGSFAALTNAILYAAGLENDSGRLPGRRADVINMSLGAERSSSLGLSFDEAMLQSAIEDARARGVVVVAAAGNGPPNGDPMAGIGQRGGVDVPAVLAGVIGVGSVYRSGTDDSGTPIVTRSIFSDYGDGLDIMAPGGSGVEENQPYGVASTLSTPNNYGEMPGTSMAAPHVAAVLALGRYIAPHASVGDLETVLFRTTRSIGNATEYGFGLVDAEQFMQTFWSRSRLVAARDVAETRQSTAEFLSNRLRTIRDSVVTESDGVLGGTPTGRIRVILDPAVLERAADPQALLDEVAAAGGVRWVAQGRHWNRAALPVDATADVLEVAAALEAHTAVILAGPETDTPLRAYAAPFQE